MKFVKGIVVISCLLLSIYFLPHIFALDIYPIISSVCEYKDGSLRAFGDGFSVFKSCTGKLRRVVTLGSSGSSGPVGSTGATGAKGDPGESFDKLVNVCFNVATGNLRVLQATSCFPDVRWKIPVQCVSGEPCKPDNPNDLYYLNNN